MFFTKGPPISEGKTKIIHSVLENPDLVIIESKNDLTKNDNPDQTIILDSKASLSTRTTAAIFQLLNKERKTVKY